MAAANTDLLKKVGLPGSATTLASPGHTIGGTSINVDSTTNWPTDTGVTFAMDTVTLVNGVETRDTGSYTVWTGVVASATSISNMVLEYGTDQNYSAGSATRVYIIPNTTRENDLVDWGLAEHAQDGTHGAITASSITATTGTFDSVTVSGTATSQGWTPLGDVPDTVTANGNRNYDLVFNAVDLTSTLSPGMKLQLTRTVAAPYQCTSLNGTTQYFSRASGSVAGMTFTNNFVVDAWVKLSSYPAAFAPIASRYNGTQGWEMKITSAGTVRIVGYNAAAANYYLVDSYASVPLNKWVRITTQLDMTGTAVTGDTNSYILFDGVEVAALGTRAGTNPTSLVQAGNLEIGGTNSGGTTFPGKLAQVSIYGAKVAQATIKPRLHQTMTGSETSLISSYSFNGVLTDLNANANTLTAQGSATATNADSPFANAVTAGTLEYAEINSVVFSTNTTVNVRVPDTCQIPTSGGVSAVSYSTQSNPYGLPYFSKVLGYTQITNNFTTTSATAVQVLGLSCPVVVPTGARVKVSYWAGTLTNSTANNVAVSIWSGVVVSGNQLARASYSPYIGTAVIPVYLDSTTTPTPGSVTFNASLLSSSGTATLGAASTTPAYLKVELV